ncbi:DUF4118 domain-containing protein [Candidatus Woesebacteria bacterium]|nr:DUF4118 domain-containing protein [Candidatus Woesebacteria bacterium]
MKYEIFKTILYYVIAVLLTSLVVSLKYYYPTIIGIDEPFLLFIFVPLFVTYIGGFYPGLFSLVLTALLAIYFFIPPVNSFRISEVATGTQVLAYIAEAFISIKIVGSLKIAQYNLLRNKLHLEEQIDIRTNKIQRASEKLQKLNLELKRSNNDLEEFAYIASHDLQEPLRKIQSFGNLLQEECKDVLKGDSELYLNRILHASGRMRKLINDLLEYSRVSRSTNILKNIDLNTVIASVISDIDLYIKETRTKIHVDEFPKIEADPLLMQQLFQNLLMNAIHYRHPDRKPVITVTAKSLKENQIVIAVQDNGMGFDQQYADKIFRIFERLYSKQEKSGTGIGLAICRKIVEQHRGTITAKSTLDFGSTFFISLPVHSQKK